MKNTTFTRRDFVRAAGTLCLATTGASLLAACAPEAARVAPASDAPQENTPAQATPEAGDALGQSSAASGVLVAYFSYPETSNTENLTEEEENSVVVVDGQAIGNTQFVAQIIARETKADEFRILTTRTYPADHAGLIAQAREEMNADDRPALAEPIPDLSAYHTVFIGYPIWWSDLPPVMRTFLETAPLDGKQIYLFNTHGGSGDAGTVADVEDMLPSAIVSPDNFVVSRNVVANCEPEVVAWLNGLGV